MANKDSCLVSIIIATYNRSHLVTSALQAVKDQVYDQWECLIIDDGSKDDTIQVLEGFIGADPRFQILKRKGKYKKGLSGCRNYGLDSAEGNYIIFFDDDDVAHPQNLEVSLTYLKETGADFCNYQKRPFYTEIPEPRHLTMDPERFQQYDQRDLEAFLTGKKAMASCTVLWNKKCFTGVRFNENLQYAEEWECYSRILMNGYKGISIDVVLYFNRKHPFSNTGEFFRGQEMRRKSMIVAAHLVLENLRIRNLMSDKLVQFFIRMGFSLGSNHLIQETLQSKNAGWFRRFKYFVGYLLYPLIKPIFKIKSQLF